MTVYFLNIIIIFIVTVICPSESLFCSYGERFSLCGKHDCVPTCVHPQGPRFCEPRCRPGCICNSGLVRRETDNKCVPIEECPDKPSEERIPDLPEAPSIPEEEQEPEENTERPGEENGEPEETDEFGWRLSRQGQANLRLGRRQRNRNRLNRQGQANLLGLDLCPEGQTFSLCGNHQCQPTCKNPAGPKGCEPTCRPGCVCTSGYVRRESDHECVPTEECPDKGDSMLRSRAKTVVWTPLKCRKCKGGSMLRSRAKTVVWTPLKCKGLRALSRRRKRPISGSYLDIGPCDLEPKVVQIPWGR